VNSLKPSDLHQPLAWIKSRPDKCRSKGNVLNLGLATSDVFDLISVRELDRAQFLV
jgi:hypothetical protein